MISLPKQKFKRLVKDLLAYDQEGALSRASWLSFLELENGNQGAQADDVIVSLTSIPQRIARLHICIESILQQELKPSRVILWLNAKDFPNLKNLPLPLRLQMRRGLEIYQCERNWSYNKLLHSLRHWPGGKIVTADDDVFYPVNWLRDLYSKHEENPNSITCHRARMILLQPDGSLSEYRKWPDRGEQLVHPSHLVFPIGVGGVLYPPECLHQDVFDTDLAYSLCPRADDIWFKIMAFRKGTTSVATGPDRPHPSVIIGSQKTSLYTSNLFCGGNDQQLKSVLNHFQIEAQSFMD